MPFQGQRGRLLDRPAIRRSGQRHPQGFAARCTWHHIVDPLRRARSPGRRRWRRPMSEREQAHPLADREEPSEFSRWWARNSWTIASMPPRSTRSPRRSRSSLTRVAFRVSRLMEFCSERELQNQTGHSMYEWPLKSPPLAADLYKLWQSPDPPPARNPNQRRSRPHCPG
jgi:hypothetical protein